MSILVIAEHDGLTLKGSTLNAITAATELGDVTVLIAGDNCDTIASQAAKLSGTNKILLAEHEIYSKPLAETLTPLIMSIARTFSHIIGPASTFGKNTQ